MKTPPGLTMTRSTLLLAAFALLAIPQSADAQLGGLIKKKVKEAIKPPEKTNPAPQPAAPAPAPSAQPQPKGRLSQPRVPGERALLISDDLIARIYRGLDAEAAMVVNLEKEIAAYPTPQMIQACKAKASQTTEGQKYLNPGNYLKEGMKPDELQAAMIKMTTESDAYFKKACPWDESKWSDYNRSNARKEIRTKAERRALMTSTDTTNTTTALADLGYGEGDLGETIERILKYCELKKTMDVSPKSGGIKVPGEGNDIYWIFTESELRALQKIDCDAFKKKYAKLLGAYT